MPATYPEGRALLIGVAAYRYAEPLPRAVIHDVADICAVLTDPERGGYAPGHVRLLRDGEATRAAILDGFRWLAESARDDSTVFIYFSGHGDRDPDSERTWFVPVDGNPDDYAHTAISDEELTRALCAVPAARLLAVLDCCHAAGAWRRPDANFYTRIKRGSGRVILTSCAADEVSAILPGARNSLFTHHLLAGLGGRFSEGNTVSVLDLGRAVAKIGEFYDQTPVLWADAVAGDFPIAACHPRNPGVDAEALVDRLSSLSPARFEELLFRLDLDAARVPAPRQTRARIVVDEYEQRQALPTLDYKIATLVPPPGVLGRLRGLVRGDVPADHHEVRAYLDWLARDLAERNGGQLAHVPLDAAPVPDERLGGEYAPRVEPARAIRHVRRMLRMLSGTARGGDHTTAQLASLDRRSRIVRDAVRTLLGSREPLVLLGDPGSGKSMTIREVGRLIATGERRRRRPRVVVYVTASRYRAIQEGKPGPVADLIRGAIPPEFARLREALPMWSEQRRLVVLFDGLDEMDRQLYTERIAALSAYASHHAGRVKTLFACRINDFIPEFRHRQLVLLPFGREQVEEFVRSAVPLPIRIEGTEVGLHRFVRRLLDDELLGASASNPLMLFLICLYVKSKRQWPSRRETLFRYYVTSIYDAYLRKAGRESDAERDRILAGLARFAYLTMARSSGTLADLRRLRDKLGVEEAEATARGGVGSGLLLDVPGEPTLFRFSHHRLQEFFAAWHLAQSAEAVEWGAVLDSPRWQETLIHLASIAPETTAVDALRELIVVPDALEARDEMLLGDRVVLAAQVLRELPRDDSAGAASLMEPVRDAVAKLSAKGRPTSQVKMLWAWRHAAEFVGVDAITPQLDSAVAWVRDQAVLAVTEVRAARRHVEGSLRYQIGIDLIMGQIGQRIPLYVKAARDREVPSALGWLTFACVLWGVYALAAVGASAYVAVPPLAALDYAPLARWSLWGGYVVVLVLLARRFGTSAVPYLPYTSVIVPVGARFWAGVPFWDAVGKAVFTEVSLTVCFFLLHAAICELYVLALRLADAREEAVPLRTWEKRSRVYALNRSFLWGSVVIAGAVAGLAAYMLGVTVFLETAVGKGCLYVVVALMVVAIAAGHIGMTIEQARKEWQSAGREPGAFGKLLAVLRSLGMSAWRGGIFAGGLVLLIGVSMLVMTVPVLLAEWTMGRPLEIKEAMRGLVLIVALPIALWGLRHSWRTRSANVEARHDVTRWQAFIASATASQQEHLLSSTDRRLLGLEPKGFLELLLGVEKSIRAEPAASVYWRLRHETEQTLRQAELDPAGESVDEPGDEPLPES